MHLVYIISAYQLPEQLVRLVNRLRTENATILLHIDRRASVDVFGAVWESVRSLPDVGLLNRHDCHWGGFGHVAASLEGLAAGRWIVQVTWTREGRTFYRELEVMAR